MPLREFQKLETFSTGDIVYQVEEVNPETGISRKVDVSQCAKLPDASMTDLAKQLKAGVNLQQVNCEVIDPVGTVNLSSGEEEKKEDA